MNTRKAKPGWVVGTRSVFVVSRSFLDSKRKDKHESHS